jgi:guanosine-3',5'-bis(diphosphate) 3'-pyrophosphohydrolase
VASLRLLQALDFAAERHSAQRRKGPDAAPYVNHLIEVASLVANLAQIEDEEVLMAAVLHDVLEDTPTTADEVVQRFGERVCRFVLALSDDKALPRRRRREVTLEHLPEMDPLVRIVKLADLSSNIKLLPPNWSDEHQREYLEWSEAAARICGPECAALADFYWERARATRALLEAKQGRLASSG